MREAIAGVEVFSGWKDIAAYLRRGVRTVQRYERQFSLPVRRPAGKSTGSVIATKSELDGWVAAAPFRAVFQLSQVSVRENAIDIRAALNELHRHVHEMHKLREETAALRTTLHQAVELLHKNLQFSLTEESSSERRLPADVLDFPSKKIQ